MKFAVSFAVAVLLLLCLCGTEASAGEPHVLVISNQVVETIHIDGSSTTDRTEIVRALDRVGVGMLSRLTIPYDADRQHVTVESASFVLPDESMHLVPANDIRTLPWPTTNQAPYYASARRTVVDFVGLQPGAVVTTHFRITSAHPWLSHTISFFSINPRTAGLGNIDYRITAPAALHLHVRANQMQGGEQAVGDQDVWQFHASELPPLVNVATTSELLAKSPYVMVSSDAGPTAVALAYLHRVRPAEHVTLELQHLADTLGGDSIVPTTLMRRYYAYINNHVRLVDIPLGLSDAWPRPAQTILLSGYGTAEDRVVLLQTLMKAKNLTSDVVLLPSLPVFWDSALPVVPDFFDRVLLTVRGGTEVMDIGQPVLAIGETDPTDRGKFGIRIGPMGGVIPIQIPGTSRRIPTATVSTNIVVQGSGALDGAATMASYEGLAATAREVVYDSDPMTLRERLAPRAPTSAQLSIEHVDSPMVPASRFVMTGTYTVPHYHPLTGDYVMPVPRVFTGLSPMDAFAAGGSAGLCERTSREEDTSIHWATPVAVIAPNDVHASVDGGLGQYTATYTYDDVSRTLRVTRHVTLRADPLDCDPVQHAAIAELAATVRKDLDATIRVSPVAPAGQ